MERSKLVTIRNAPESRLTTTASALTLGYPLGRSLTASERLVVAVVQAEPTHFLTIHSTKSREEVQRGFRCIRLRLQRSRGKNAAPMIYVATFPRSQNGPGHHVHALLWSYVHLPTLHGYCRDLALGPPQIDRISASGPGDARYWRPIGYVLGQHEPVFGSTEHERHEPLGHSKRRLSYPQRATLAKYCPKLLSALEMANDPTVSDQELCAGLPRFSNTVRQS
jgi:hypothetical protein